LVGKDGKPVDPADEQAVQDAITPMVSDPATLVKLKELDTEFQETMAKLGYDNVVDLEKLRVEDVSNARSREIAVKDYTPEIGFYLLIGVFAFFLHWLFKGAVPAENRAIVYSAFGSLSTLVITATGYFYGTTRQSVSKDNTIANSVPINAVNALKK
jgi:hypothetical protein